MNKDILLLMVTFFTISFIMLYKYIIFNNKKKNMLEVKGICTDTTCRTGYSKNTYIYYYTFSYKDEEYNTSDISKIKHILWNVKIKDEVIIYINKKNPNDNITPLVFFYYKLRLYFSIILIVTSLLILYSTKF